MELIGIAQRSGLDDLSAEAYAEAAARADLDPPVLEGVGGKVTGGDDGGGAGTSPRGTTTTTTTTPAAAASPSGSGSPSPQHYAYARDSSSAAAQHHGNGKERGGGSGKGSQPSMKTITGVVDGLKQIYFGKGSTFFLSFFLFPFFFRCFWSIIWTIERARRRRCGVE